MNPCARLFSIIVCASLLATGCFAQPSQALDRTEGDLWRYDVRCSVAGVVVEGVMEYAYSGMTAIEVEGVAYEVNVIKVTGSFSGAANEPSFDLSVSGLFDGCLYESVDGVGMVREDLTTIANVSMGYEDFSIATLVEEEESLTYSQPLMAGFDTGGWELESGWNETVTVYSLETYSDGTVFYEEDDVSESSYAFSAAPVPFPLETGAGSFSSSMITFSDGDTLRIMWYSPEIDGFVRMERFDPPFSSPAFVAVLSEHEQGSSGDDLALILSLLGVGLALVVLASVVVVAVMRRNVRSPPDASDDRTEPLDPESNGRSADEGREVE